MLRSGLGTAAVTVPKVTMRSCNCMPPAWAGEHSEMLSTTAKGLAAAPWGVVPNLMQISLLPSPC